jgi:hypothetical protein
MAILCPVLQFKRLYTMLKNIWKAEEPSLTSEYFPKLLGVWAVVLNTEEALAAMPFILDILARQYDRLKEEVPVLGS